MPTIENCSACVCVAYIIKLTCQNQCMARDHVSPIPRNAVRLLTLIFVCDQSVVEFRTTKYTIHV